MKNSILLLYLFSCILVACGDDEVETEQTMNAASSTLQYKFKQGQEFYVNLDWYEIVDKRDSTGKGLVDTMQMNSSFRYVVDRVDENGTASISVNYHRMRMKNFDSDDTATRNTPQGMMFAGMMNYVFKAKMDKKGRVLEFTDGDNFYTLGAPDTLVDDNAVLQADMQQFFNILPDGEAKEGQTWTNTHTIGFGYPGIFNNQFKLVSLKEGIATIAVTSEISPYPQGLTVFPGGTVVQQNLSGKRSSTIQFDIAKGMINSSNVRDFYSGEALISSGEHRFQFSKIVELHKDAKVEVK